MTTPRKRLTWDAEPPRKASAAPANPTEGAAHPAHKPDPGEHDYENGDTSSWAEDVHKGPYPNSAHPATPDEGPASPAYKAAADMEKRAAKCIRIASRMLGDHGNDPQKVAAIEDQAMSLMNLSDRDIHASLIRLGEDVEEEEEEGSKKASLSKAAAADIADNKSRIARLERILIKLAEDEDAEDDDVDDEEGSKKAADEEGSKKAADDEEEEEEGSKKSAMYMDDDDALLEGMLKEEGMFDDEPSLAAMLADEGMLDDVEDIVEDDIMIDDDPMGVMDMEMGEDEMMVLAQLHPEMAKAAKTADDDEEEEVVVEEEGKKKGKSAAERTAAAAAARDAKPRPQPRTASSGASRLGGVSKSASDEISELEAMWKSAPDISSHF